MHAVVFEVDMKEGWEGDADAELDQLTTMVSGLSFIVFPSEDVARGVAANASMPPTASLTPRNVSVHEIVREA